MKTACDLITRLTVLLGFSVILFHRRNKQLNVDSIFENVRMSVDKAKYYSYKLQSLAIFHAIKHICVYQLEINF